MVPPFVLHHMNRIVIYLIVSLWGITDINAQGKLFREESDGFKWYSVWTDDFQGAQDVLGNDIIPLYKYRYVNYSSENGVFQIVIKEDDLLNGKFGYCTRRGKIIINPEQVDKSVIVEIDGTKYIKVSKQGKYGAYSLEGKVIVPCEYDECLLYSIPVRSPRRGHLLYFCARKGGKESVYDLSGKQVIPLKYKEIRYNDWDDCYKGFEGKLENEIAYRKLGINIPITYSVSEIRDMYNEAYNTKDINKQLNIYNQIISNDPNNIAGLNSYVYNNLGVIYENKSDFKKAKICYQNAVNIDPQNTIASDNLKNVKNNIHNERLERIVNIFGYLSQVWGAVNGEKNANYSTGSLSDSYSGGSGSSGNGKDIMTLPTTPTTYQDGEKIWRKDAGYGMIYVCKEKNGIRNETLYGLCKMCRGTKICSTCQGSRLCNFCQGKGGIVTSGYGQYLPCTACNRTGSCSLCQGTGRCSCTNYEYPGYNPGSTTLYDINGNIISTTSFTSGSSSSASSESRSSHSSTKSPCSRCHGTGVDPSPSSGGNLSAWVAHYNATGETCPYCNRVTEHWHTRCSTCNVPQ